MTRRDAAARTQPVWRDTAAGPSVRLETKTTADVAVIGAGFVGLAAALELARSGRSVVILEASALATGASAASAGQVGPLFYGARKTPGDVNATLGLDRGERLNRKVADSGRWLFEMIEAQGIECAHRQGFMCVYRSEKGLARAADSFAQWQAFGGRSERIDRKGLRDWTASSRYAGGFFLPDGGFLDPARLIGGMAAAARRAGVRLYTDSRVVTMERSGGAWVLNAGQGRVAAPQVLVATGSAGLPAWPKLNRTFYPIPCGIAATAPLPDRGTSLLPRGDPVADLDDPGIFAPAVTADGRLLVSFLMSGTPARPDRSAEPARRRISRAFPGARLPSFDSLSWGWIALTPDGLPRLLRGPAGMLAITGCNGFGLTLGMVAAREAASLLAGTSEERLCLPVTQSRLLPAARLLPALFRNLLVPVVNRLGA